MVAFFVIFVVLHDLKKNTMNKIPSVNLKDFLSEDPNKKKQFIKDIGKAYEEIGFVALKGHFLDDTLVDNLYKEIKNFFALPVETKRKYEIPGIGGQRGDPALAECRPGRGAGAVHSGQRLYFPAHADPISAGIGPHPGTPSG